VTFQLGSFGTDVLPLASHLPPPKASMANSVMALLLEVQTDEYWKDINLPILEILRRRLRKLVKLIEPEQRKIVYSDFEDEIGSAVDIGQKWATTGRLELWDN
jgi:type I site-specific restriction endonuclease